MGSESGPGAFHELLGKEQNLEALPVPAQMPCPSSQNVNSSLQINCKSFSLRFRTAWPNLSVISPDPSLPTSATKPFYMPFLEYFTLLPSSTHLSLLPAPPPLVFVSLAMPNATNSLPPGAVVSEPHHLDLYVSHCVALTLSWVYVAVYCLIAPPGWKCPRQSMKLFHLRQV